MTTTQSKNLNKSNLKRTTIFLTQEHHEALRRMAFEKRTSMANLIREAVVEIIEDDEDIREIAKAREEGGEYITLEEFDRQYRAAHKGK